MCGGSCFKFLFISGEVQNGVPAVTSTDVEDPSDKVPTVVAKIKHVIWTHAGPIIR